MSVSPNATGLPRALRWAIKNGNKNDILKVLQEKNVGLELTTKNGDTLAHLIIQNKNCAEDDVIELLQTLFNQGIDPNIENCEQETVLHLAVAKRMRGVVDFLVKCNVNINKTDKDGYSIAHFFIQDEDKRFSIFEDEHCRLKISARKLEKMESESANFVEWLIEKGFDFDRRNNLGESALDLSIECNLHHILIVLLKHTNDVNYITEDNENLLCSFLWKTADYRERYGYNSQYAATIVKFLLDKGVPAVTLTNNGRSALYMAIEGEQESSVIEMVITHIMKTCAQNNLATNVLVELFASCAWWGDSKAEYYLSVLRTLVTEGANVNSRDKYGTPLHSAFEAKNVRAVKFLEDHGADFSVIDEQGQNLFHELALRPYYDKSTNEEKESLFELLLSKGCCDMHAGDKDQDTPLHLACRMHTKENLVTARKLIEHGADVNCKNKNGQTPLHYAVMDGGVKMTQLLLKSGANVNSKNKRGERPIHYATGNRKGRTVLTLLKWGAFVNHPLDTFRGTPFFIAIKRNWLSIAKQMLKYGADINDDDMCRRFIRWPKPRRYPIRQLVLDHWIKLDAAKLPCLEDYKTTYKENEKKLYRGCYSEIKRLENTFIDSDSHTSIYAFLHMDFGSRRIYINNEELKNLVDSPNLKRQFPRYYVLILASYRETVTWKSLLQPAKQAWRELAGIALPDICSEMIFAYLKNEDLLNIIDCVEDVPQ